MRILVLGGDGYLGWPTALHLSASGHKVGLVDSFARRGYDTELGRDNRKVRSQFEDGKESGQVPGAGS